MRAGKQAAGHHASAADHHAQAAHSHRSATRHYKTGKDVAHAAHRALTAHGHALRALAFGRAAIDLYGAQAPSPAPAPAPAPGAPAHPARPSPSAGPAVALPPDEAAHHAAAACHHDAAAEDHAAAGRLLEADDHVGALRCSRTASAHALEALHHGNQAAMHHAAYRNDAGCDPVLRDPVEAGPAARYGRDGVPDRAVALRERSGRLAGRDFAGIVSDDWSSARG